MKKILIIGNKPLHIFFLYKLSKKNYELSFLCSEKLKSNTFIINQDTFDIKPYLINNYPKINFDLIISENNLEELSKYESKIILTNTYYENNLESKLIFVSYTFFDLIGNKISLESISDSLILGNINNEKYYQENLMDIFIDIDIKSKFSDNFKNEKWIKLVWNASFNALSCFTEKNIKELLSENSTRSTLIRLMNEVIRLGKKNDVQFGNNLIAHFLRNSYSLENRTELTQEKINQKKSELGRYNKIILDLAKEINFRVPENEKLWEGLSKI